VSPSTGKFELFRRGLACNIVGVCLAGDDEQLERRVVGRLLLQLYVGWSQCVGAIFAGKSVHLRYFCKLCVMEMVWSQVL
jgi:hypothetical protein